MTGPGRERRPVALELRLAYLLPLPASAVGVLLAGLLAGLYLLARWQLGPPLWIPADHAWRRLAPDARDVLVALAAAGFIVAAIRQAVEGNTRDLRAAAKHGGFPLPRERPPTTLVRASALRRARGAALVGALLGLGLGVAADPRTPPCRTAPCGAGWPARAWW